MGKIIKKKIRGMNLWAKLGIVTVLTLFMTVFMYNGWYKPLFSHAATITSTTTGGTWATGSTWVGNVVPAVGDTVIIVGPVDIAANITQTAAGSVSINTGGSLTTSGGTITFGALNISSGTTATIRRNFTVLGNTTVSGTINFFSSSTTTGRTNTFSGDITLNGGSNWIETINTSAIPTFTFGGNFTNNATTFTTLAGAHAFTGTAKTLNGVSTFTTATPTFSGTYTNTGTLSVPTTTITGAFTNSGTMTAGTLTVTGAAVILTNNGTLTATTALSGTGRVTNGATGVLNIGGTSAITTLTATAVGNTVNYTGAAQTAKATTYNNLTLSGSGTKTFATTPTVNGVLSLEGTASVVATTGVVTYGAAATLQYNKPAPYTATSEEWITPFTASGGIKIANTGVISMNSAETISSTSKLTVNSGSTLALANFGLNLAGNYVGGTTTNAIITSTGTAGVVTFNGANQTISGNTSWPRLAITGTVARTVTFQSASTQTVTAALTLSGAVGQLLTLAPITAATPWNLVLSGTPTQSIGYVNASYSNATGGTAVNAIAATNVNGGNNTNWTFPVTDTTAPVIGTITITPTSGIFTTSTPTISSLITEPDTTVTGCDYATSGTNWLPGTVGGASPNWSCTSPVLSGLSGALTINVRASNSVGLTGTGGTPLSITADVTAPVDGTLTATSGVSQNVLSWSGFSDAGVGLSSSDAYKLVFLTGATAPAIKCTNGTDLTAVTTGTAYTHTPLANGTQYYYRLCAIDAFGNVSDGTAATATPSALPSNTAVTTSVSVASAATESTVNVLMQRLKIDSDSVASSDNAFILNSLTLDNSGTATQIAAVKIYLDSNAPSAALPSTALLVGGKRNWSGATTQLQLTGGTDVQCTIAFGTSKYIYIVYDMAFGQVGKTVQSHVTALGAAAPDTSATVTLSSINFMLSAGSSVAVLTACSSCHASPPVDASGIPPQRGTPVGSVVGSHTKHAAAVCATCHVAPADTTSASFDHRNGAIEFVPAVAYTRGTSVGQSNDLTGAGLGICVTASCHDNGKGVSAPSPTWGAATAACTACHALIPADSSHLKHISVTTFSTKPVCADCHNGYVQGTTANATNHLDTNIDVYKTTAGDLGYPPDKVKGSAVASCTTAYCHSSGQSADGASATPVYAPITWGGSVTCTSCHGATAATLTTGSHAKHLLTYPDCGTCHTGATASAYTAATHINSSIDVGVGTYTAGGAPGNGYGTCSTASCHKNVYGTGTTTTTTWGVAGCGACHSIAIGTNGPATGGHTTHTGFLCTSCHTAGTSATTVPSTGHIDDLITVTTGYTVSAKHAANSGYGTCTTSLCHGSSSPVWGVSTLNATCTKCHGKPTLINYSASNAQSAPGYGGTGISIAGASASTDSKVGAHDTHLRALNGISSRITCVQCHSVPATAAAAGHTDSALPAEVTFGPLATSGSGTAPSYNSLTGTCSNTYCHYGRTTYATPATANGAVVWNNSAYLNGGTPSLTGDCGKCHASPPSTTGSHAGVTTINQCNGCHDHVTTSGTFSDPSKHINGTVDQQGCNGCHGWPPTTNAHTIHINNIIAERGLAGLPGGFLNNEVCGTCHNVSSLSKHAGSVGNDGSSRNIYLPAPSTLQATYQFGASAVSYDKVGTTKCSNISCHLITSKAWGTPPTTSCQTCHGYPPVTIAADVDNKHATGATAVNHIGTGSTVNTKDTFVSAHGGCQICHGTQDSGLGTQAPHANYTVATDHATGTINMNGPVGTGTGYDSTILGCTAACHASTAPYRMTTSGKTLTYGNYGTGGDCISCHSVSQTSPIAAALDATVTSRVAISGDFTLTSSHTRSRTSKVATKEDCCVCHMEGDVASGSANGTYHKNGYVELRDPDLGATIKAVTHSGTTAAAGVYTSTANDAKFVRFKRNLGIMLENETSLPFTGSLNTNFQVIGGIMVNHCLKCHDANGATSTTAQIPAASGGTAFKPFGATVAANGANAGVLDVASQFASTNRSQHPVLVKNNNNFTNTGGTRLVAPWNASVTKTGSSVAQSNTVYGALISCWDCHAPNGSTAATTLSTTMTHGKTKTVTTDAVELRGSVYLSSTTTAGNLCLNCHVVSGGTTLHGTGSAMATSGSNGSMTYFQNRCYFCHSGVETNAHAARPIGAGDVHGYNTTSTGAAITTGGKGYAFIRRTGLGQIVKAVGATSYTTTCGSGTGICTQGMGTYAPGGVF